MSLLPACLGSPCEPLVGCMWPECNVTERPRRLNRDLRGRSLVVMSEHARAAKSTAAEPVGSHVPRGRGVHLSAVSRLQTAAGNQAVARMVQRKDLGSAKGGKTWMSTGGFDS